MNEKADSESRELAAEEIYETFKKEYLEKPKSAKASFVRNSKAFR